MLATILTISLTTLIQKTHLIKCPDYFHTYINPSITNFIDNSKDYPTSITHCPDFKDPADSLCCESQEYLILAEKFSRKYYKTQENIQLMQAYAEQLANSLTGISELLLEVTNSTVTINQVRRIKESLESFSESFQSTSNNQRCLNTLFAHEGSILCLMCNGQMTKDMVIVENSLFRG